jgi:hypothetical protein
LSSYKIEGRLKRKTLYIKIKDRNPSIKAEESMRRHNPNKKQKQTTNYK